MEKTTVTVIEPWKTQVRPRRRYGDNLKLRTSFYMNILYFHDSSRFSTLSANDWLPTSQLYANTVLHPPEVRTVKTSGEMVRRPRLIDLYI